jgi:hypothetical protein
MKALAVDGRKLFGLGRPLLSGLPELSMSGNPYTQGQSDARSGSLQVMKTDPPLPDPKKIPPSTEELIRAGEKLFKKAREINDKYESVIERHRMPLKEEPEPPFED